MQIIHLTPGTGGNFYCENCLRDNAAVPALRRAGHDAIVVPLYLPVEIAGGDGGIGRRVFFGGINVYLQQRFRIFRHTPAWLDRLLDAPWLLRWAGRRSGMTDSRQLGETLLSMLRGRDGNQRKEVDRLIDYLADHERPEVIFISSVLLAGLAPRLAERLGVPIVCLLQGEGGFIDGLPADLAAACWRTLRERMAAVDRCVAVSAYYRDLMVGKLGLDPRSVPVVPVGLIVGPYHPAETPPDPPAIGFLSRACADRGLDELVDAFVVLKRAGDTRTVLRVAGGALGSDQPFLAAQRAKLAAIGCADALDLVTEHDAEARAAFLRGVSVLSVPERVPEGYGLFLLEAGASGVPVVQPDKGPYPEILAQTGGGVLCRPDDPEDLAAKLRELLDDPGRARELGAIARERVLADCTDDAMAARLAAVFAEVVGRRGGA